MKEILSKLNFKSYINKRIRQRSESLLARNKFIPISKTEDQDVFIAGFPKSGNTWMQNLVAGLVFGIDTNFLPDSLTQELVPDVHYKEVYKRFHDFTCFKTHRLPTTKYRRVIYLTRDPRDVIVSYFHFKKNYFGDLAIEDLIMPEKGVLHEWQNHTQEWMRNPYDAEIIHVKYEDLVDDSFNQLLKISGFLNLKSSDEILSKVIEGNKFSNMQEKENQWGFDNDANKKKIGGRFFRRGEVGSYKDELSRVQISRIEEVVADEISKLNYVQGI